MAMKTVNELLKEHGGSASKINVRELVIDRREADEVEEGLPAQSYVFIEGDTNALRFLAELILAQIDSDYGCELDIHPAGAGSSHFSPESTLGIYVHRLPCDMSGGIVEPPTVDPSV
jgi:hypothetical protein